MRCEANPQTHQIDVTWDRHTVSFDDGTTGPPPILLTVETLQRMLTFHGSTVHVRWNRAPSRAALHLIYDTLATVPHLTPNPSKAEAFDAYGPAEAPPRHEAPPHGTNETVWHVESLHELTAGNYGGLMFNHVWALRAMLHFPVELYQQKHIQIANDLARMVANIEPMAIVRSYSLANETPVPLLLWFRLDENQVFRMLQEYMHLCHPECRMWHWQLVPSGITPSFVANAFAAANILPSLHQMFTTLLHPPAKLPPFAVLESLAERLAKDPTHHLQFTLYENGAGVMWIHDQVFFYTRDEEDDDAKRVIERVHVPTTIEELPPWVPRLFKASTDPATQKIEDHINIYLQLFIGANPSRTKEFLRQINWATLPLFWTPIFLKDPSLDVRKSDSREAQNRLVELLGPDQTEDTRNEALDVIRVFTGVAVAKRSHTEEP